SAATSSHGRRPLPSDPDSPVLLGRGSRPDTGVDLGSGSCSADSRGPAAQPVIASAGELAPLVRGTARAHSRGSVFMALPPAPDGEVANRDCSLPRRWAARWKGWLSAGSGHTSP